MSPGSHSKFESLVQIAVALVLFGALWGLVSPKLGGSRRADRTVFIHDADGFGSVVVEEEFDRLVEMADSLDGFVVVMCFYRRDFLPGIMLPILEKRSVNMMVFSYGDRSDSLAEQRYELIAANVLKSDPVALRYNPGGTEKMSVAWVPLLILITGVSLWWWTSAKIGSWLACDIRYFFVVRPRRLKNQCVHCSCSCEGNSKGKCPECGNPYDQNGSSEA